jgi:hypothetical protein
MSRARVSTSIVEALVPFTYVRATWGNDLVRYPTSGTATYTAIEEYSGAYAAGQAADGGAGNDWAASGYSANDWWNVAWSVAQSVNMVRLRCRSTSSWGYGHLEFETGPNVPFDTTVPGETLTIYTGVRSTSFIKAVSEGGGSGDAGLAIFEAYSSTNIIEGAGIDQYIVEVLGEFPSSANVTQYLIEALMAEADAKTNPPTEGGGTPQTHVFGYAG